MKNRITAVLGVSLLSFYHAIPPSSFWYWPTLFLIAYCIFWIGVAASKADDYDRIEWPRR